jgi:hypothetical protein
MLCKEPVRENVLGSINNWYDDNNLCLLLHLISYKSQAQHYHFYWNKVKLSYNIFLIFDQNFQIFPSNMDHVWKRFRN